MTFTQWWSQVNQIVENKIGVTADDMPDLVFIRDYFDYGDTPQEGAEVLFEAWVDDGCLPEDMV